MALADDPFGSRRIAICQEWVMTWSGSEQVAARMAEVLDADVVFTFAGRSELIRKVFGQRTVRTSVFDRIPALQRHWPWLLPVMPFWWRSLDLSALEVVVTSSHAFTNSVRTRHDALHVSYCSTPMRYAWTWRNELGRLPTPMRPFWPMVAALLRRADRRRAQNVDLFIANSRNVARRIAAHYGMPSIVVYPPVDTDFFTPDPTVPKDEFYLYAGRLIAYKRPAVAVEAASRAGVRLVVAGSGPELSRLRTLAGSNVEFREQPSGEELRDLYRRARALVFPGVEDFGMVLVEAQACGTPVIAYAEGGALEAVLDGDTGRLYHDPSPNGLAAVLRSFHPDRYDSEALAAHAERFGRERFDKAVKSIVGTLAEAPPHLRPATARRLIQTSELGYTDV